MHDLPHTPVLLPHSKKSPLLKNCLKIDPNEKIALIFIISVEKGLFY